MLDINPVAMILGLSLLALAPFIVVMITSYAKLVIVLSLIRNALGIQQVPPNMVVNGLAIILTVFVMAPVISASHDALVSKHGEKIPSLAEAIGSADELAAPLQQFLTKHSDARTRIFFLRAALKLWPRDKAVTLTPDSFYILVPAFILTELTEAFQMAFLLYLPFVVIDLVISNILLAMGMMMVSPMTISLPFKLLLFVMLDGWSKIIEGIILTYR